MAVIQELFWKVYCMPLYQLTVICIALCGIFLELRSKYCHHVWWKLLMFVAAAVSICLIGMDTVWNRASDSVQAAPILMPFHTYRAYFAQPFEEILRMNFMNTLLFFPGGLFLCEVLPAKWKGWIKVLLIVVLLGALSAGIEYAQYSYALGQAEIDDVIHNTLGALLGTLVSVISRAIQKKTPET